MKDFLNHNFDKLLLSGLIIVFLITYVSSRGANGDFAIRTMDTLNGALVGIITGARLAASAAQKSEPKHDEPPKSS
jgi:hypothetical protein